MIAILVTISPFTRGRTGRPQPETWSATFWRLVYKQLVPSRNQNPWRSWNGAWRVEISRKSNISQFKNET